MHRTPCARRDASIIEMMLANSSARGWVRVLFMVTILRQPKNGVKDFFLLLGKLVAGAAGDAIVARLCQDDRTTRAVYGRAASPDTSRELLAGSSGSNASFECAWAAPVSGRADHWEARLPFYYGWVIVGVAFMTMAIGVTARTSFSLLLPPLIDEFGWDRGRVAGAFSFGFLVSAITSPIAGRVMDRYGPRVVIEAGVCLVAAGLWFAQAIERPWQLYLTLGVLVGAGTNLMSSRRNRSICRTGSRGGGRWRSASRFPASGSGQFCCCRGCRRSSARRAGGLRAGRSR